MRLHGNTKRLKIVNVNGEKDALTERTYAGDGEIRVEYPLYQNNYESGLRQIFDMALEQEQYLKGNKGMDISGECGNILSFIGRRGSGKTTAVNEFCRILESMESQTVRQQWMKKILKEKEREELLRKTFRFHILSPIDASLLGEKEDLFELILANIYRHFEERKGSHGFLEDKQNIRIAQDLQSIFERYFSANLTGGSYERGEWRHSAASVVNYMASSHDIREDIEEFLDRLFQAEGKSCDYEYIVITIDDLDLNLEHGYEMLEQLLKYFSYHKIIILLTMDYKQMGLVCEEHFYQKMPYTVKRSERNQDTYGKTLTNDYMTKVFRFSQRLYMPNIKKLGNQIRVSTQDESGEEVVISAKRFTMYKMAEIMKIYYDGCGLKRHFCEAETVRDFVSYNEFLESLRVVDYEMLVERDSIGEKRHQEILDNYDFNYQRVYEDIVVRLAQNTLSGEQKTAFENIEARDPERQAMYFVNMKRTGSGIELEDIEGKDYSYGALLEKIYKWGRGNMADKPFISCILAFFTVEMTREYLHMRYNSSKEMRNRYRKILASLLGKSFLNGWSAESIPVINVYVNNEPRPMAFYCREVETEKIVVDFDLEDLKTLKGRRLTNGTKMQWEKTIAKWMDEKCVLEILQCLDMLMVREEGGTFEGLDFKCVFAPLVTRERDEKTPENTAEPGASNMEENTSVRFCVERDVRMDIMGIVAKSLNYREEKERLEGNLSAVLTDALTGYLGLEREKQDILRDILEKIIEEKSEFHGTDISKVEVAYPFYNLDLAYNVWKRYRRSSLERQHYAQKEFVKCMIDFYGRIENELEKEERYYAEEIKPGYLENFRQCPYIKMIRGIEKDKQEKVSEALVTALRSALGFSVYNKPQDVEGERKNG